MGRGNLTDKQEYGTEACELIICSIKGFKVKGPCFLSISCLPLFSTMLPFMIGKEGQDELERYVHTELPLGG